MRFPRLPIDPSNAGSNYEQSPACLGNTVVRCIREFVVDIVSERLEVLCNRLCNDAISKRAQMRNVFHDEEQWFQGFDESDKFAVEIVLTGDPVLYLFAETQYLPTPDQRKALAWRSSDDHIDMRNAEFCYQRLRMLDCLDIPAEGLGEQVC